MSNKFANINVSMLVINLTSTLQIKKKEMNEENCLEKSAKANKIFCDSNVTNKR